MPAALYPRWDYFPRNVRPPEWVEPLVSQVRAVQERISTVEQCTGLHSDDVLRELAPGLKQLGYAVEASRSEADRIRRPVLFGSNGRAEVSYDIDAFHDEFGIVVEVEAGRVASNNATYRDIIRASLILDAKYLVLLLPVAYASTTAASSPRWLPSPEALICCLRSTPASAYHCRSAACCSSGTDLSATERQ